jgi:hypothetical protein
MTVKATRTFLSDKLKKKIRQDARTQGALAAAINVAGPQLSTFMRDEVAIGYLIYPKIVKLGQMLGVEESECFKEVPR